MNQFLGLLNEIYDGASTAATARWTATDYFDKVLFAAPSVSPLYWPGFGVARPIPGLPDDAKYDGIEVFGSRVLLWSDYTIRWCAENDFSNWVPVGSTAAVGNGTTIPRFIQLNVGSTTDWVYLDAVNGTFVVGQFVRITTDQDDPAAVTYNFYLVDDIALSGSQVSLSIPVSQTIEAGETARIYTSNFVNWGEDIHLRVDNVAKELRVDDKTRENTSFFALASASSTIPAVGGQINLPLAEFPFDLEVGDIVSVGTSALPGLDLYEIIEVGLVLRAKRLGTGSSQVPAGNFAATTTFVTFQPWVSVENLSSEDIVVNPTVFVSAQDALKLQNLAYSGAIPSGQFVPAGSFLETLNANDAGEVINVGSQINGSIYAVVALGNYGYILKNRSIQSMQDVGRDNGVYNIQPEILDEGPIGRYAWCRISDGALVIWGHKDFFIYRGGQTISPIIRQYSRNVYDDVDMSRADEIIAHHKTADKEVWFVYPSLSGATKVLVYNYDEDSATMDEYDDSLNGITAVGEVDWEVAPTWESLPLTALWNSENKKWYEFVEDGEKRYSVIAIGGDTGNAAFGEDPNETVPRLLLHGRQYSRSSNTDCEKFGYDCEAETPDFDFGDSAVFKYVDTIQFGIQAVAADGLVSPMKLRIQVGARDNLDSDIRWTDEDLLEVSGNGAPITKSNLRAGGRYIRLRFKSDEPAIQWRISFYRIMARKGGTY